MTGQPMAGKLVAAGQLYYIRVHTNGDEVTDSDLSCTGYSHDQHRTVYSLLKNGRGRVVYCAKVVQ